MFGLGKASKLREIDQKFGQILSVLSSGGDKRAAEAIDGLREALGKASGQAKSGWEDSYISQYMATEATRHEGRTPGRSLGYIIVALMYEARSLGTKEAIYLASRIQEFAYETVSRFQSTSAETMVTASFPSRGKTANDVPDEKLESAIGIAEVLQNILKKIGVYENNPMYLLRPHALGYIWGWCDATTQKVGLPMNSPEALGMCSVLFMSFFKKKNFDPADEDGLNPQVLTHANKLREKGDNKFFDGMKLGGADLFTVIREGDFPQSMSKNIVDIFAEGYGARFRE